MTPSEIEPSKTDSSTRDEAIQSPYDRLLNRALQHVEAARSLLQFHLPFDVASNLKLQTLAPADTSFIDHNLRRRFADRLFSVEVSDEIVENLGLKNKFVHLLVLIDHKSTADPLTLIQMLGYIVRIWENAIENKRAITPIIPWVIYNGIRPWQSAKSLQELMPVPDARKQYVPGLELPILDIGRTADAALVGEPILQLTFTLLKYGREPNLEVPLRQVLRLLSKSLSDQQAKNWLDTIRIYIMSVNPALGEERINELASEFWPVKPEPGSIADQLIKKGEARGEVRGEARGEARGERSGEMRLIRTLQSILHVPLSSDDELVGKGLEELRSISESHQQQILNRS